MEPYTEYVALTSLRAPGTMVFGYRPGDGVPAAAVEAWELTVGVDVMPRDTGVIPRPEKDSDDRAAWEAYALGQGRPADEVSAASLADLKKTPEPATDEETGAPVALADPFGEPERPAPDAKKADWVAYVIATGADKDWASDRATTKADLQDYSPKRDVVPNEPAIVSPSEGDSVAESATAAQTDARE
jgi:hypothetical protein